MPDMAAISVSLPALSTAILPDAWAVNSGQSTGMDLKAILANIDRRLKVLQISAHEASLDSGHQDVIRNLRRKVKNGKASKGSLRADTLEDLARALKCSVEDLKRPVDASGAALVPGMRDILLARRELLDRERALIDEQLAAMDEAEFTGKKGGKRKHR